MANFKHKVFLLIAKWIPVAVAAGILINVSKLDKALSLIADDKGMVDADGLLTDMIDRLIVSKANTINGVTIGEGSVKITIPFMNKTVVFDKDDFNELKTNIENYEKSK